MRENTLDLAKRLGQTLLARHYRVTTAESCTGGGVAQAITEVPGSSAWFEYGFITYANRAKIDLLGVDAASLQARGAVSREVVAQMATGALLAASANLAVAVSGVAGPDGGTPEKPVGTVWFAWARDDSHLDTARYLLQGDRAEIRSQAVELALSGLIALADADI